MNKFQARVLINAARNELKDIPAMVAKLSNKPEVGEERFSEGHYLGLIRGKAEAVIFLLEDTDEVRHE